MKLLLKTLMVILHIVDEAHKMVVDNSWKQDLIKQIGAKWTIEMSSLTMIFCSRH